MGLIQRHGGGVRRKNGFIVRASSGGATPCCCDGRFCGCKGKTRSQYRVQISGVHVGKAHLYQSLPGFTCTPCDKIIIRDDDPGYIGPLRPLAQPGGNWIVNGGPCAASFGIPCVYYKSVCPAPLHDSDPQAAGYRYWYGDAGVVVWRMPSPFKGMVRYGARIDVRLFFVSTYGDPNPNATSLVKYFTPSGPLFMGFADVDDDACDGPVTIANQVVWLDPDHYTKFTDPYNCGNADSSDSTPFGDSYDSDAGLPAVLKNPYRELICPDLIAGWGAGGHVTVTPTHGLVENVYKADPNDFTPPCVERCGSDEPPDPSGPDSSSDSGPGLCLAAQQPEDFGAQNDNHWSYGYFADGGADAAGLTLLPDVFGGGGYHGNESFATPHLVPDAGTGLLSMHPGASSLNSSVVRWTAATAADLRIVGTTLMLDTGYTVTRVRKNGIDLFNAPSGVNFDLRTHVAKDDAIDVVINAAGRSNSDSTGLQLKIYATCGTHPYDPPPPPDPPDPSGCSVCELMGTWNSDQGDVMEVGEFDPLLQANRMTENGSPGWLYCENNGNVVMALDSGGAVFGTVPNCNLIHLPGLNSSYYREQ